MLLLNATRHDTNQGQLILDKYRGSPTLLIHSQNFRNLKNIYFL